MIIDEAPPARSAPTAPLIVTADAGLLDHALVAVAAAGLEADVVHDVGAGRPGPDAATVLIGADVAGRWPRRRTPRSARLVLIGSPADRDAMCDWSAELDAAVVVVPDQLSRLTAVLSERPDRSGGGAVIAVLGGSGGVGASTLATAIACRAADGSSPVALIDADPWGGGLDLCLGAEGVPGWRWSRLAAVSGHLDGLRERLPELDGVSVVAADRDGDGPAPDAAAVDAVIRACRDSHQLVVIDLGRGAGELIDIGLERADRLLVVIGDEIRQVAAAQALLARNAERVTAWSWVLRRGHGSGLTADAVGEAVGRPAVAVLPQLRGVRAAALRGDPPHRVGSRRWSNAIGRILSSVSQ